MSRSFSSLSFQEHAIKIGHTCTFFNTCNNKKSHLLFVKDKVFLLSLFPFYTENDIMNLQYCMSFLSFPFNKFHTILCLHSAHALSCRQPISTQFHGISPWWLWFRCIVWVQWIKSWWNKRSQKTHKQHKLQQGIKKCDTQRLYFTFLLFKYASNHISFSFCVPIIQLEF